MASKIKMSIIVAGGYILGIYPIFPRLPTLRVHLFQVLKIEQHKFSRFHVQTHYFGLCKLQILQREFFWGEGSAEVDLGVAEEKIFSLFLLLFFKLKKETEKNNSKNRVFFRYP